MKIKERILKKIYTWYEEYKEEIKKLYWIEIDYDWCWVKMIWKKLYIIEIWFEIDDVYYEYIYWKDSEELKKEIEKRLDKVEEYLKNKLKKQIEMYEWRIRALKRALEES